MRKIEQWKFVPAYEGLYMVSTLGRVKSLITGKILKPWKNKNGYLSVSLCKDGLIKRLYIHRLVALAFIPNPENKRTVNHKDEVKTNNCVENLEWMTDKENTDYSRTFEKANEATRTPIAAYKDGELIGVFESQSEAARQLGLNQPHINMVLKRICKQAKGFTFKYAE